MSVKTGSLCIGGSSICQESVKSAGAVYTESVYRGTLCVLETTGIAGHDSNLLNTSHIGKGKRWRNGQKLSESPKRTPFRQSFGWFSPETAMTKILNDGRAQQSQTAPTDRPQGTQHGLRLDPRFSDVPSIAQWLATKNGYYDDKPPAIAERDYCAEVFAIPEAPSLQQLLSRFVGEQ